MSVSRILRNWAVYSEGGRLKSANLTPESGNTDGCDYAQECYWYIERWLALGNNDAAFRGVLGHVYWGLQSPESYVPRLKLTQTGLTNSGDAEAWRELGIDDADGAARRGRMELCQYMADHPAPTPYRVLEEAVEPSEAERGGIYLTTSEVADVVGVHLSTVTRRIAAGKLAAERRNGCLLVREDRAREWAEKRRVA